MTTATTAYQPTQASSSTSPSSLPVNPQTPAQAAAPASQPWAPNCVTSRHNAVVQRINNWGYCCKCVVKLEITKDSSKLGDIAKVAILALANLGLAFYDVAKGAFCMVKGIVTKVLCCYRKTAPATGAPAQGAAPATGGSAPQAPAQVDGSGQPAPAQVGGSSPQEPAQASGSAPQAPAQPALINQAELNQALAEITERINQNNVALMRLAQIEATFNQHIGTNNTRINGLTDSFAELSTNLGASEARRVAGHTALDARISTLEGAALHTRESTSSAWEPRAGIAPDTSSSSTTSTSPATSSSSSSSTQAQPIAVDLQAQIAELQKTPEGVQQLVRMFSGLAAKQTPAITLL